MKYSTRLSDAVHILAFIALYPNCDLTSNKLAESISDESCLCAPAHVRPAEGRTAGQREGTSPTCSGS